MVSKELPRSTTMALIQIRNNPWHKVSARELVNLQKGPGHYDQIQRELRKVNHDLRQAQDQRATGDQWRLMMNIPATLFYGFVTSRPGCFDSPEDTKKVLSEIWDEFEDTRAAPEKGNPWKKRR